MFLIVMNVNIFGYTFINKLKRVKLKLCLFKDNWTVLVFLKLFYLIIEVFFFVCCILLEIQFFMYV